MLIWASALLVLTGSLALGTAASQSAAPTRNRAFAGFIASLWPMAEALGVSRETFDRAFEGVAFDPKVVAETQRQAEFTIPIWSYIGAAAAPDRIARGRGRAQEVAPWLAKASRTYGVDPGVIMGIWGLETDFGAAPGSFDVVRSLASLAFVRFRDDYFRDELLSALAILQAGDIAPRAMSGSWAGAMGQTQFMPSSFLAYAVDFDGAGRRDIWTSEADAIGSTANYLVGHGWMRDLPWGFEVALPAQFALADAEFGKDRAVLRFRRARRRPGRRKAISGHRRGSAAASGRPQGADLPRHRQLRRYQGIQFLDGLRARRRLARRRRERRVKPRRILAGVGPRPEPR